MVNSTDLAVLERFAASPIDPPVLKKLPAPEADEMEAARQAEVASVAAGTPRRCGGQLQQPGAVKSYSGALDLSSVGESVISLRIVVDGSCLEVFTCSGQALGTRVYRGDEAPLNAVATAPNTTSSSSCSSETMAYDGQIQLVSFGPGPALLLDASAWSMNNMWAQKEQQEAVPVVLPQPAMTPISAAAAEVLQGLAAAEAAAAAAVSLPAGQLAVDVALAAEDAPSPALLSPASAVEATA